MTRALKSVTLIHLCSPCITMRVRFPHIRFHGRPLQIVYTETSSCGMAVVVFLRINCLESKQQQERHHKTEQSHSFRQGETQNGV